MEVIKGKTPSVPKLMIYGQAGCGKTTLASKLKNSLIIDIENGANYIDTPRVSYKRTASGLKLPIDYSYFMDILTELYNAEKREYDNIVIDSLDWLVRIFVEQVAGIGKGATKEDIASSLKNNMNDANGGYGKSWEILENRIKSDLLKRFDLLNQKGYGITLIAHSEVKEMSDEDGVAIEKVQPKILPKNKASARIAPVFIEWCDFVFYLKNTNGNRKLLLESDLNAVAKNRTGLTGEVDIADVDINDILSGKYNNNKEFR